MAIYDDYLPCKSYSGFELDPKFPGFSTFKDEKTSKFYFALLDTTGTVLLRSEGYKDAKSRKNGIESVIKNLPIDGRLSLIKDKSKYFLVLKAGNNQEIARSCDYAKKADAENMLSVLTEKSDTKIDKVEPTVSKKTKAKAGNNKAKVETNVLIDQYLSVPQYLNKERIWDSYGITGFVKFRAENGLYYFGVYNPDATLYLRSIGYKFEEDRDNAFDLMESTILLEENYRIENINGKYYAVLFEETEILAISPEFDTFIDAFVTTPGGRPKEYIGTMY
jgi:uncharacterized protein YegP (UPF0339 family)